MKITYREKKRETLDWKENRNLTGFHKIAQMYSFTTENIAGYFPYLDFNNKTVLTVAASGDHIINAFYQGAKKVIGFDINYLALIFTELKLVALEQLSYEEFLTFFMRNDLKDKEKNKNALDYIIYKEKLRDQLTKQTAKVWDSIYEHFNKDGYQLRNSHFFNNKYDCNTLKINSNLYLKEKETYQAAKEKVKGKQIQLVNKSFQNIDKNNLPNLKDCDIVLMSNISDYIKDLYPNKSHYLEEYIKDITKRFKTTNNHIVCAYLYHIQNKEYRSQIDNPLIRKQVFDKLDIICTNKTFPSVMENCIDSILII